MMDSRAEKLEQELVTVKRELAREKEITELYRENSALLRKQLQFANEKIVQLETQLRTSSRAATSTEFGRHSNIASPTSTNSNANKASASARFASSNIELNQNYFGTPQLNKAHRKSFPTSSTKQKRKLREAAQQRTFEQYSQRSKRLVECSKHRAEYAERRKIVNDIMKMQPDLIDNADEFRRVILSDSRIQALPIALRPASFIDSLLRRLRNKRKRLEAKMRDGSQIAVDISNRSSHGDISDLVTQRSARSLFDIAERGESNHGQDDSDEENHKNDETGENDHMDAASGGDETTNDEAEEPSEHEPDAAEAEADADANDDADARTPTPPSSPDANEFERSALQGSFVDGEQDHKPAVVTDTQIRNFLQESDDDDDGMEMLF